MEERAKARANRYIALDIHKHYRVIVGVDREGRILLHAVQVEQAALEAWLKKHLSSTDQIVIESTTKQSYWPCDPN